MGAGDLRYCAEIMNRHLITLMASLALLANGHHQKNTATWLGLTYHQLRNPVRKHGLIGG